MAYTTIDDPSAHFQTALWTGTGSAGNAVTFDGNSDMQPDFVWSKRRDVGYSHVLKDTSRGGTSNNDLHLVSDLTNAESTYTNYRMDFDSDGFTLDGVGDSGFQGSGTSMVSWAWKANGGTTSSNTDGTITSTVQANTTAGFSIVTFTGNGSNDATIGHGLGVTPAFIITKNRADTVSWRVWHKDLTPTYMLFLNSNNSQTSPTGQGNGYIKTVGSSTYSVYQGTTDTNGVNGSGDAMVSYCFADKQGFSKFGKYEGNGNANGPFVYTGFRPALVIFKEIDAGDEFVIIDSKRDTYNAADATLYANLSNAEENPASSVTGVDLLSNGFKFRDSKGFWNTSGSTYIYMAFAENPFVTSTGIPTTAR
jgi:hypothetical protein